MADVVDTVDWRTRVASRYDARMASSNVVDLGLPNDGTLITAAMITSFVGRFGNGRRLVFPPGLYSLASAAGIQLTDDNLLIECWGDVEIRQTVAGGRIFVVGSHTNAGNGLTFDLRAARLNSTVAKPGTTPPAWTTGTGAVPVAHAAIEHLNGDDLTISGGLLQDWTQSIAFRGSTANTTTRSKNFRVFNTRFNRHDQGIIARQIDGGEIRGVVGTNAEKTTAEFPHLVYIMDHTAIESRDLTIADSMERDNAASSGFRVRNVVGLVLDNLKVTRSPRGIEVEYCDDPLIVGCSVTGAIAPTVADTQQSAYTILDCIGGKLESCYGEVPTGVSSYGIRVGTAVTGSQQQGLEINDTTLRITQTGTEVGGIKPAIYLENATRTIIDGFHYILGGAASVWPVEVGPGSDLTRVIRPKLTQLGTGTAAATSPARLLRTLTGAGPLLAAANTTLQVDRALWPTWHATNSLADLGSGTQIIRVDGITSGSWTPTAGFATNGTFAPAGTVDMRGYYTRRGDTVEVYFYVAFDANAYTGASGTFRVGGLPFVAGTGLRPAATGIVWTVALAEIRGITLGTGTRSIVGQIASGDSFMTFRQVGSATAGSVFGTGQVVSGQAGVMLAGMAEYQIVEP